MEQSIRDFRDSVRALVEAQESDAQPAAPTQAAPTDDTQDAVNDFLQWLEGRGALGPGPLSERIFIAGWLAGKCRAAIDRCAQAAQGSGVQADECAANMNGHSFGPHGRKGETQCRWCAASPAPSAAPAQQASVKDMLRWSKANTDYHGLIAFTPAQFDHFVSMLRAAPAQTKPRFDEQIFRTMVATWAHSFKGAPDDIKLAGRKEKYWRNIMEYVAAAPAQVAPVQMILRCPKCGLQHVDAPEPRFADNGEDDTTWTNPPHRSHLCHGCGHIWRPADVPTEGVAAIQTRGSNDSPAAQVAQGEPVIGAGDPMAVFAAFCEREGYPSDGIMDEALKAAFYEGIRYCAAPVAPSQHIPGNFTTHRSAWRDAITSCINYEETHGTADQAAYWQHELAAYDRSFARLLDKPEAAARSPSQPQQAGAQEGEQSAAARKLEWTGPHKPNHEISYDHVIAQTPFGRILITWKSWKDDPGYAIDEHPLEETVHWNGFDLEHTKTQAEEQYFAAIDRAAHQASAQEGGA